MARNESSLISPFLDQLLEFMDCVYLVDHGSIDSTRAKIQSHPASKKIDLYSLRSSGYPQDKLATHFAHKLLDDDCDFVFFLDCDEFLPFRNRNQLEKFLSSHKSEDYFLMPWLNVRPKYLDGRNIFEHEFLTNEKLSHFKKIVISKRIRSKDPNFTIEKGYHGVKSSIRDLHLTSSVTKNYLIHIPIQSYLQFATKLISGTKVLSNDKSWDVVKNGNHWFALLEKIRVFEPESLNWNSMVFYYSEDKYDAHDEVITCNFDFDYIHTEFTENPMESMSRLLEEKFKANSSDSNSSNFLVDKNGNFENFEHTATGNYQDFDPSENLINKRINFTNIFSEIQNIDIEKLLFQRPMLPEGIYSDPATPLLNLVNSYIDGETFVEISGGGEAIFCATATRMQTLKRKTNHFFISDYSKIKDLNRYRYPFNNGGFAEFAKVFFGKNIYVGSKFDYFNSIRNSKIDCLYLTYCENFPQVEEILSDWSEKLSTSGVIVMHQLRAKKNDHHSEKVLSALKLNFPFIDLGDKADIIIFFVGDLSEKKRELMDLQKIAGFKNYVEVALLIGEQLFDLTLASGSTSSTEIQHLRDRLSAIENSKIWRLSSFYRALRSKTK